MADDLTPKREHWGGRAAFILAAIGSAVGLGNLWGFPYKLYEGGGGAFLVPYFIAMIVIGLPLLIMEFAVGHWAQNSPPGAFAKVFKRYRFAGWWLTAIAYIIITYYTIILGYAVVLLWDSLVGMVTGNLPWAGSVDDAKGYFFGDVVNYEETYALGIPQWPVVIGMLLSWVAIYFCLFKGVKWVSKIVLITVPLPWLMLVILTVRGVTLDGADTGLHYYLEPDWSKLLIADTWRLAFGQVFFSLSLGFAVMLSYASFLHRKSDLNNNAAIIGLGDLATSFIAGIAVFAVIGSMAKATNTPVQDAVESGPGLAFAVYPYALSQLGGAAAAFAAIFFVALLTLGIDSAFSIVEAVQSSINDNRKKSWRKSWTLPAICLVGASIGILFATGRGGLNWLAAADDQVNGPFGILSVALAECLIVGYAWKGGFVKAMREHANERSDWKLGAWWDAIIRYVAPAFLLTLIAWSISDFVAKDIWTNSDAQTGFGWHAALIQLGGYVIFALIPLAIILLTRRSAADDSPAEPEKTGPVWPILTLPAIATLVGLVWGILRHVLAGDPQEAPTEAVAAAAPAAPVFEAAAIGGTGYTVLAVAFAVIFGGLAWCFWKAMQAAGANDEELADE